MEIKIKLKLLQEANKKFNSKFHLICMYQSNMNLYFNIFNFDLTER